MIQKIFGIGLSRTGTSSLAKAMQMLGYRSAHFPNGVLRLGREGLLLDFHVVDCFDFVNDSPIAYFFRDLDKRYPGSLFIYTVRELESWLVSCEELFWMADKYFDECTHRLHESLYGGRTFDRYRFQESYIRHANAVWEYFRERRDDLLVLDICGGDGWERLCAFLQKPIPAEPFPRQNARHWQGGIKEDIEAGRACLQNGDAAAALACFDKVLNRDPGNILAMNERAVTLVQLGRHEDAHAVLRHALSVEPNYSVAAFNLVLLLSMRGQRDEALRVFDEYAHILDEDQRRQIVQRIGGG